MGLGKAGASDSPAGESEQGFLTRVEAVRLIAAVLHRHAQLDAAFDQSVNSGPLSAVSSRDRRFCYAIVAMTLRRKGEIDLRLGELLSRPLPRSAGPTREILLATAAQLLFMRVPSHAAVGLAVRIAKADPHAKHFAALINAIGRKLASLGSLDGAPADPSINTPAWLYERWVGAYGEDVARPIALAHLAEPPLDVTVLGDPQWWAERLGGTPATAQTVRLNDVQGAISDLPGYEEGKWWVQDEAAAIPARLLGPVDGKHVLDLCAAPGGKTAQLAAAGARVTAVDRSVSKMARLKQNLARLRLSAETVVADAMDFETAGVFDAVLLDAPCSATGIIRRHPDIPYHRRLEDIARLAELQGKLLDRAAALTRLGGHIVFCTCSIEPEEGEHHLEKLPSGLELVPLEPGESGVQAQWLDRRGCLRTLPNQGLDGFFAMCLRRI